MIINNDYSEFQTALCKLEANLRYCEDSVLLIDGFLQGVADYYGADRAYIIETDWELNVGLNTYEWCQPGVEHQKDMLQFMAMEIFPRWKKYLAENQPVIVPDMEALKADSPDEYYFFKKYQVSSILCAPFSKRINQGFVGVDNPTKHRDDPTFLLVISYVLVLELNEIKMQQTVDAAERRASRYNNNEVYVKTFGGLELSNHKGILLDDDIKSDQCYDLLTFLLLNHRYKFPVERLYEIVRPLDISMDADPYSIVKNVVYRTKKSLAVIGLEELIISKNGSFVLNPEININTDFDRMDDTCQKLSVATDSDTMQSLYDAIAGLYGGIILPRICAALWMLPKVSYYQSLYMRVVKGYIVRKIHINDPLSAQRAIRDGLTIEPNDYDLNFMMAYYLALHGNIIAAQDYIAHNENSILAEHRRALDNLIAGTRLTEQELMTLMHF